MCHVCCSVVEVFAHFAGCRVFSGVWIKMSVDVGAILACIIRPGTRAVNSTAVRCLYPVILRLRREYFQAVTDVHENCNWKCPPVRRVITFRMLNGCRVSDPSPCAGFPVRCSSVCECLSVPDVRRLYDEINDTEAGLWLMCFNRVF